MKSHINLVTFHHGDLEIAPTHEHTHEHTRKHALVTSHCPRLQVTTEKEEKGSEGKTGNTGGKTPTATGGDASR